MKRCFIFGALPVSFFPEKPYSGDLIIAADKGYDQALNLGIEPDLIVGDFDSRGKAPELDNVIRLNIRKDETDVGYAVELGFERGYNEFVVYGAVGGLLDHTLANIAIARDIAERGGKPLFIGNEYSFTVIRNSSVRFAAKDGGRISVFALSDTAEGVNISGLDYEASGLDIPCTSHIGVSNGFIGKEAEISVGEGTLLVVYQSV